MTNGQCYIIAEIGVNHNGDIEVAKRLIDAAVAAQADAVKFQSFKAEDLVSRTAKRAEYQARNTNNRGTQFEMLKALELSEDDTSQLCEYCRTAGIDFLSTPFSEDAVDMLDRVGVSRYKFSSGDLTHLPLLAHAAQKGKPMIISTGMANLSEIEEALDTIYKHGNLQVSVLHCVSNYPAEDKDCNLKAMDTIRAAFDLEVGWSDHSLGSAISFAAVARGASIIEKHITLDQNMEGPDHLASMEPTDFTKFVEGIRSIERAIGDGRKLPTEAELETAKVARRSLVARSSFPAGHTIRPEDIVILRPGTGIPPKSLNLIIGMTLTKDVAEDQTLKWTDFKID